MLQIAHILLMSLYIVLPPLMLVGIFALPRRRSIESVGLLPNATVAIATALLLGISASVIYDLWLGGISSPLQMLLTCYWAAGLICILKVLDLVLDSFTRLVFRSFRDWKRSDRQNAAQLARVILLFSIGLPYMIVAAATYRPGTIQKNAGPWFDLGANSVSFDSTDGLRIVGFWTPAIADADHSNPRWGRQTVIICPGSRGGRTAYINLAKDFLDRGYNVLTFDFRAHGQSDGQIDSFGDHERRDVLGAVRWLRANNPIAAKRIVGIGIDTGGAALLAAAADPAPEGRAIEAMAVFGCYDRFDKLAADASLPPFMEWLIGPVGLPLACVQTGADLWDFSPARAVAEIAPRPILFVHGLNDPVIDFERGQALYDAAVGPRSHIWLDDLTDEQAVNDPSIVNQARHFLDTAVPML
jgi:fermentation-respiration switch protein FrsA (DUF1100 family)